MSKSFDLSLEQQFNIRSFEHQVKDMSREQAQEFLVNMYRQMILQENSYRTLLRQQWGMEEPEQQAA
jgi:Phycobilisome degradation protein nblA